MGEKLNVKIKIIRKGPYMVYGSIPLEEKIITKDGKGYVYKDGKKYPLKEKYALCRCGKSKSKPFCDGKHKQYSNRCTEKNDRKSYFENAVIYDGSEVFLTDNESLCASARFCHTNKGTIWELQKSQISSYKNDIIKSASECPSGRLITWDKITKEEIEPIFKPSIVVLQDPENGVSGPLWVRGNIQIEGADGFLYELRNRVTLCRCGNSKNTPFCDSMHILSGFNDNI